MELLRSRWGNWEKERGRRGRFRVHGMSLWKKICDDNGSFMDYVRWQLWNEGDISFQHDEWMSCYKLKDFYPRIYEIACDKEAKLRDNCVKVGEGWIWDVKIIRNLQDCETNEFCNLLRCLNSRKLNDTRDMKVET